jgi:hypothetical protein
MILNTIRVWSIVLLCGLGIAAQAFAQEPGEHTAFETPEAAVEALVGALRADDRTALLRILGPDSEEIIDSGDSLADKADQAEFLAMYDTANSLQATGDTVRTLIIGEDDWPFAVPVVQTDGRWRLDGSAGVDEIIYRRIGGNELGAIAVCRGFVDAQREYAAESRDGDPAGIYAFKLISDEGLRNGLYWPTEEGELPSPAGPFVAAAAAEGYHRSEQRQPYHGYYYRMLYQQGESAAGGARDYFKDGALTEGFALLAWPAEYGVSGVMSFMVNQDGIVYQRDLGEDTDAVADRIESFDPGQWQAVPEIAEN